MQQEVYKLDSSGKYVTQYNGQSVVLDGTVYSNPPDDILWAAGYRPMGQGVMPDYDPETHWLSVVEYYLNDDQTEIIPRYEIVPIPAIEDIEKPDPDIEERVATLEQRMNDMDTRVIDTVEVLQILHGEVTE